LNREECPKRCVLCNANPTQVAEKHVVARNEKEKLLNTNSIDNNDCDGDYYFGLLAWMERARIEMDLDDDELDDDDFDLEAKLKKERELEEKKKGPIIPMSPDLCQASESKCRHFAHEKCIEEYRAEFGPAARCPRCNDLQSRVHRNLPHSVYCEETTTHIRDMPGGFTASAKIEEAIKWFQTTVPENEKAIILSFFKGSLDLIEGILTTKLGIECTRYDGDVDKEVRTRDLHRFKTRNTCRVLLATVQSGGTGLNITEANHVCFLDRWFNPCVHDQAESRCHRIGQKKGVNISYLDINLTIDIVMKRINVLKEGNASVVLADGTSLGDRWSLGYRNISGMIGNTLKALFIMRQDVVKRDGDALLPPCDESDLDQKVAEILQGKLNPPFKIDEQERKAESEAKQASILLKPENDNVFLEKVKTETKEIRRSKSIATDLPARKPLSDDDDDDDCLFLNQASIFGSVKSETKAKIESHLSPKASAPTAVAATVSTTTKAMTVKTETKEIGRSNLVPIDLSMCQPLSDDDDDDDCLLLLQAPVFGSIKSEMKSKTEPYHSSTASPPTAVAKITQEVTGTRPSTSLETDGIHDTDQPNREFRSSTRSDDQNDITKITDA